MSCFCFLDKSAETEVFPGIYFPQIAQMNTQISQMLLLINFTNTIEKNLRNLRNLRIHLRNLREIHARKYNPG